MKVARKQILSGLDLEVQEQIVISMTHNEASDLVEIMAWCGEGDLPELIASEDGNGPEASRFMTNVFNMLQRIGLDRRDSSFGPYRSRHAPEVTTTSRVRSLRYSGRYNVSERGYAASNPVGTPVSAPPHEDDDETQ